MSEPRSLPAPAALLRPAGLLLGLVVCCPVVSATSLPCPLFAGVALFLLGMRYLEDGFRAFTGGALERWLAASTDRLWKSLTFGTLSTGWCSPVH
ncbi:hypothetical protein UMZ34_10335 [Halopseudomonas pachastrellae]|nr:hypothetical protein UMZ34_10335 [Halopseudomonas pachastrellae]